MTAPGEHRPLGPPIRVIRTLAIAVLAMPVVLGLVVFVAVPEGGYPAPFLPLVLGAVAVGGVLLSETVGYAAPAIVPGTPRPTAAEFALQQYRSRWLVRSLSTELVILVGLLLSFMLASWWPYLIAFVLGWPIMVYELWPARRLADKLNLRLEVQGAISYLDDALHSRPLGMS